MRYIFLIFSVLTLQSCFISHETNIAGLQKSDFSPGSEIISINVPLFLAKPILNAKLRTDPEAESIRRFISKIQKIRMLIVENSSTYNDAPVKNFVAAQQMENWMTVKSADARIHLFATQNNAEIRRLFMSVAEAGSQVFIDIRGKFTPEDISQLISGLQQKSARKN